MRILFCFVLLMTAPAPAEELTHDLDGLEITYTYSGGMSFNVRYTPAGVKYRYLTGDAPEKWWGPFPYTAYKTSGGLYFLSWYEKGFGDHVAHLLDLKNKTLYGAALIVKRGGNVELTETARIEKMAGGKAPR